MDGGRADRAGAGGSLSRAANGLAPPARPPGAGCVSRTSGRPAPRVPRLARGRAPESRSQRPSRRNHRQARPDRRDGPDALARAADHDTGGACGIPEPPPGRARHGLRTCAASSERSPRSRCCNYRYRWIERPGGLPRLLETPKPLLKDLQRQVLRGILDRLPPHPDAHGFRRGRSAVTNARLHAGQRVVIGFDLEDFFASVWASRVYSASSASSAIPSPWPTTPDRSSHERRHAWSHGAAGFRLTLRSISRRHRLGRRLLLRHTFRKGRRPHPALANLAAYGLDCRLSALAATFDAGNYSRYTRFDLTFSGDERLLGAAAGFQRLVAEIVADEGFA